MALQFEEAIVLHFFLTGQVDGVLQLAQYIPTVVIDPFGLKLEFEWKLNEGGLDLSHSFAPFAGEWIVDIKVKGPDRAAETGKETQVEMIHQFEIRNDIDRITRIGLRSESIISGHGRKVALWLDEEVVIIDPKKKPKVDDLRIIFRLILKLPLTKDRSGCKREEDDIEKRPFQHHVNETRRALFYCFVDVGHSEGDRSSCLFVESDLSEDPEKTISIRESFNTFR